MTFNFDIYKNNPEDFFNELYDKSLDDFESPESMEIFHILEKLFDTYEQEVVFNALNSHVDLFTDTCCSDNFEGTDLCFLDNYIVKGRYTQLVDLCSAPFTDEELAAILEEASHKACINDAIDVIIENFPVELDSSYGSFMDIELGDVYDASDAC